MRQKKEQIVNIGTHTIRVLESEGGPIVLNLPGGYSRINPYETAAEGDCHEGIDLGK